MHQRFLAGLVVSAGLLVVAGCGKPGSTGASGGAPVGLTVKGSDTMVQLGQAWAEAYGKTGKTVNVTGGGSGTGIAALIDNNTDIAESSRALKPEEIAQARAKGGDPVQTVVAQDGLSVIVNKSNPVQKLTIAQLSDIFSGKVTNWKEVGGPDARVSILSRDKSSGSFDFFLDNVVRKGNEKLTSVEYAGFAKQLPSSESIVQEVTNAAGGIGYVGLGYAHAAGIKTLAVAKTAAGPFVMPSEDTVLNKTYPISRPLLFITRSAPSGETKAYLDWVLGPDGQAIVTQKEFVPVKR